MLMLKQMEGVRVFNEADWKASGMDATKFAEKELKDSLEGLAKHLFGDVSGAWNGGGMRMRVRVPCCYLGVGHA